MILSSHDYGKTSGLNQIEATDRATQAGYQRVQHAFIHVVGGGGGGGGRWFTFERKRSRSSHWEGYIATVIYGNRKLLSKLAKMKRNWFMYRNLQ